MRKKAKLAFFSTHKKKKFSSTFGQQKTIFFEQKRKRTFCGKCAYKSARIECLSLTHLTANSTVNKSLDWRSSRPPPGLTTEDYQQQQKEKKKHLLASYKRKIGPVIGSAQTRINSTLGSIRTVLPH